MATTPKPTVIVVDADLSMRRALRMQLQLAGFNVLVFESAESLMDGEVPTNNACLLLDIYKMPGMSSVELRQGLAATGRHPPIVLTSACDDELTCRVVTEVNAVACLFKPFDEKALLGAIRQALGKQSKIPR